MFCGFFNFCVHFCSIMAGISDSLALLDRAADLTSEEVAAADNHRLPSAIQKRTRTAAAADDGAGDFLWRKCGTAADRSRVYAGKKRRGGAMLQQNGIAATAIIRDS